MLHAPAMQQDSRPGRLPFDGRSIVMIGMMGAGKTSIGKRLAARLGTAFVDADTEIETAAGMSIPEIFARHGEAYFRDGERRVIARLLAGGPKVIATGGGAYMNARTREEIARLGISVWLKADFDVLLRRVRKRTNRPLLQTANPEATLRRLMEDRYPVYAAADLTVLSNDGPHEQVVDHVVAALSSLVGHGAASGAVAAAPLRLRVDLGMRGYDILVGDGLIAAAGGHIGQVAPGAACAIVTDAHVARAHLPALEASLDAAGIAHRAIIVPPGETTKSYAQFAMVCDGLIEARIERGDFVIALGGGVVGDLAGFCAASLRRGVRLVQMPTTLLAQVDSSVGGKTGINSPHGKNLVGAFHQPILVLADTAALSTLPRREFTAGYAEVVKYGLIDNRDFFEWLERHHDAIFAGGPELTHAIATSCAAKAAVVARDETEQGDRALLNLGHTFGHALERLTGYDSTRLIHGEAVSIGMACAFRLSVRMGLCAGQDATRVQAHLRRANLPVRIGEIAGFVETPAQIVDAMMQDKKVQRGALTLILARGIGESFVARNVDVAEIGAFLAADMTDGV